MVTPLQQLWYIIPAIIVSVLFMAAAVYHTNKLFKGEVKDAMTKVVLLILVALTVLWIVDKMVIISRPLLTEKQSQDLFDLLKYLIILIFGVFFGSKQKEK